MRAAAPDVVAVGFGIPALVEWETGVARWSTHLPLEDVRFRDLMTGGGNGMSSILSVCVGAVGGGTTVGTTGGGAEHDFQAKKPIPAKSKTATPT